MSVPQQLANHFLLLPGIHLAPPPTMCSVWPRPLTCTPRPSSLKAVLDMLKGLTSMQLDRRPKSSSPVPLSMCRDAHWVLLHRTGSRPCREGPGECSATSKPVYTLLKGLSPLTLNLDTKPCQTVTNTSLLETQFYRHDFPKCVF